MSGQVTKEDLRQKYAVDLKREIAKSYASGQYSYGSLALA